MKQVSPRAHRLPSFSATASAHVPLAGRAGAEEPPPQEEGRGAPPPRPVSPHPQAAPGPSVRWSLQQLL